MFEPLKRFFQHQPGSARTVSGDDVSGGKEQTDDPSPSPGLKAFLEGTSNVLMYEDIDPAGAADVARYEEALRLKAQGDLSAAAALLEKSCCPPSIYTGHYRALFQVWRLQNKEDLYKGNHASVIDRVLKMIRYDDEMVDTMQQHWSCVQNRTLSPDYFQSDRNLKVSDVRCLAKAATGAGRSDLHAVTETLLCRFQKDKPTEADQLPVETFAASRISDTGSWVYLGAKYKYPEELVLSAYRSQGFDACWCRGGAVNLVMKCAAFPVLIRYNSFGSREDARTRFFEAQCTILADKADEVVRAIAHATTEEVSNAAAEILAEASVANFYGRLTPDFLRKVWEALGATTVTEIARLFMSKPYDYRSGWPDLTLIGPGGVRFVEVSTTGRLQPNILRIVRTFAQPLGLKFSLALVRSE